MFVVASVHSHAAPPLKSGSVKAVSQGAAAVDGRWQVILMLCQSRQIGVTVR